ncbi:MAG TPA: autotransporter-associated beta strand repeat-containing protein [Rhizomicrobium sp.]|jgi:autotransporter-associated beta strand protein|nr:autotransporter-associated beta strand repeat-containing protein [Rhizomicrobium sp.]
MSDGDVWKGGSGNWNDAAHWSLGVPGVGADAHIEQVGSYRVTLSDAQQAQQLSISGGAKLLETKTGSLNIASIVEIADGTVLLHNANTVSTEVDLYSGALLETFVGTALGEGALAMFGGEFVAGQTQTLDNSLSLGSNSTATSLTIAAAHGKSLNFSGDWNVRTSGTTVTFGTAADDGVINWGDGSGTATAKTFTLHVAGGTLRPADGGSSLEHLISDATSTTVAKDATLDLHGYTSTFGIFQLRGAGLVTNGDALHASSILLGGTNVFSGQITGNLSLSLSGGATLKLAGDSTYTGGTHVNSGTRLVLGNGGTTGSVAGDIASSGSVVINHSNTFALTNALSGGGTLTQQGSGTTTIHRAELYTGGTIVAKGTLSINKGAALGTGSLTVNGGELLATTNVAVDNQLIVDGTATFAAANGKTLTLNHAFTDAGIVIDPGSKLVFGDNTHHGTVAWQFELSYLPRGYTVDVADGVLAAASNDAIGQLCGNAKSTTIEKDAAIDLAGFSDTIANLHGSGVLRSADAAVAIIYGGNFAGQINGAVKAEIHGAVTLSGGGNFASAQVLSGATLKLIHAAQENVTLADHATLILQTAAQFTGKIGGFSAGDKIALRNLTANHAIARTYNVDSHILTVSDGTHTDKLHFTGSYASANFKIAHDADGGIDVLFHALHEKPPHSANHNFAHSDAIAQALAAHGAEWFAHHAAHADVMFG